MWGEFGRTPKINNNAGRDHWAPVMGALVFPTRRFPHVDQKSGVSGVSGWPWRATTCAT